MAEALPVLTTRSTAQDVRLLVLDVDGTLTDGSIILAADGTESKRFSVRDGMGLRLVREAGVQVAVLSARSAGAVEHRMKQLKIECVVQGADNKAIGIQRVLEQTGIAPEYTAMMGDDILDLPAMVRTGFAVAVGDAAPEVKQHAEYVTAAHGGDGAVRETCEFLLKEQGKWAGLVRKYLAL